MSARAEIYACFAPGEAGHERRPLNDDLIADVPEVRHDMQEVTDLLSPMPDLMYNPCHGKRDILHAGGVRRH